MTGLFVRHGGKPAEGECLPAKTGEAKGRGSGDGAGWPDSAGKGAVWAVCVWSGLSLRGGDE